jgi:hypothetical protein
LLVFDSIVIPFFAVILLGVMDKPARDRDRNMAEWFVNLGWNVCVLATGAGPGIFASQHAAKLFTAERAVRYGYIFEFFCLILGAGVSRIKSSESKNGLDAVLALLLGGVLVGTLTYVGLE